MNTIVLITGAAGGVGKALVSCFESNQQINPVKIAVVSRDADKLRQAYGTQHTQIVADVGTHDGALAAVAACIEQLGTPSQFAHCVGNILLAPAARTSEAQYREIMRANLDSAFFMLSAVIGAAKAVNQTAALCFVSTIAAQIGIANHEAIAAAKGGLEAAVRSAAATYAVNGIRVNAVAPGLMDTPAAAKFISTPTLREASAKQYPLGTIGSADEVAHLMQWLLSESAKRVTGQIWTIDGGFTAIRPLVR